MGRHISTRQRTITPDTDASGPPPSRIHLSRPHRIVTDDLQSKKQPRQPSPPRINQKLLNINEAKLKKIIAQQFDLEILLKKNEGLRIESEMQRAEEYLALIDEYEKKLNTGEIILLQHALPEFETKLEPEAEPEVDIESEIESEPEAEPQPLRKNSKAHVPIKISPPSPKAKRKNSHSGMYRNETCIVVNDKGVLLRLFCPRCPDSDEFAGVDDFLQHCNKIHKKAFKYLHEVEQACSAPVDENLIPETHSIYKSLRHIQKQRLKNNTDGLSKQSSNSNGTKSSPTVSDKVRLTEIPKPAYKTLTPPPPERGRAVKSPSRYVSKRHEDQEVKELERPTEKLKRQRLKPNGNHLKQAVSKSKSSLDVDELIDFIFGETHEKSSSSESESDEERTPIETNTSHMKGATNNINGEDDGDDNDDGGVDLIGSESKPIFGMTPIKMSSRSIPSSQIRKEEQLIVDDEDEDEEEDDEDDENEDNEGEDENESEDEDEELSHNEQPNNGTESYVDGNSANKEISIRRGRGTPRKYNKFEHTEDATSDSSAFKIMAGNLPPKRGRGRPRKYPLNSDSETTRAPLVSKTVSSKNSKANDYETGIRKIQSNRGFETIGNSTRSKANKKHLRSGYI